jgi:hypothetical protein
VILYGSLQTDRAATESLLQIREMDEKMLAEFASPVRTEGWAGQAFLALLLDSHTRKLKPELEFIDCVKSQFGASLPEAYSLYGRLTDLAHVPHPPGGPP